MFIGALLILDSRMAARIKTFILTPFTVGSSPGSQTQKRRSRLPSLMHRSTTSFRRSALMLLTDTFRLLKGPPSARLSRTSLSTSSRSPGLLLSTRDLSASSARGLSVSRDSSTSRARGGGGWSGDLGRSGGLLEMGLTSGLLPLGRRESSRRRPELLGLDSSRLGALGGVGRRCFLRNGLLDLFTSLFSSSFRSFFKLSMLLANPSTSCLISAISAELAAEVAASCLGVWISSLTSEGRDLDVSAGRDLDVSAGRDLEDATLPLALIVTGCTRGMRCWISFKLAWMSLQSRQTPPHLISVHFHEDVWMSSASYPRALTQWSTVSPSATESFQDGFVPSYMGPQVPTLIGVVQILAPHVNRGPATIQSMLSKASSASDDDDLSLAIQCFVQLLLDLLEVCGVVPSDIGVVSSGIGGHGFFKIRRGCVGCICCWFQLVFAMTLCKSGGNFTYWDLSQVLQSLCEIQYK